MSDETSSKGPGRVGWVDLTVADAGALKPFYEAVVGWGSSGFDMGGYEDFVMTRGEGEAVAGICHARGTNAEQPPGWMVYFTVANMEASLAEVEARGGKALSAIKQAGEMGRFCVIEDPSGAVCSLFEEA